MTPTSDGVRLKVLFVVGSGRSGTTILGNLLGELDGFFHAGELQRLCGPLLSQGIPCGCGTSVGTCDFWSSVLADSFNESGAGGSSPASAAALRARVVRMRQLPWLLLEANHVSTGSSSVAEYRAIAHRLYESVARQARSGVIVDSSKGVADAAILATLPGVEPYFVHLVRDPRAVAYSWHRQRTQRPGWGNADIWTAQRVAFNWVLMQSFTAALRRLDRKDRWMTLRYEDFLRAPVATTEALVQFVREKPRPMPFVDERTIRLSPNHTAGGNGNRFRSGQVRLELDDEWTTAQPMRDRMIATALALPLLGQFGYPMRATQRIPRVPPQTAIRGG